MIVDNTGTPRSISFVEVETYRDDFNLLKFVSTGDFRSNLTQHKVYQIF